MTKILGAFLITAMHAIFPPHLTLHDSVTLIIFGKENLLILQFPHPPATCSHSGADVLLCSCPLMLETSASSHS
jgi:hypothetical protein